MKKIDDKAELEASAAESRDCRRDGGATMPQRGSAGVPPATGRESSSRFGEVTIRTRGHLPHWEKESATYFVTFRLADSLPKSILEQIESERWSIIKTAKSLNRELSADEKTRLRSLSTRRVEQYLDIGAGACYLRRPAVAEMVANAITHFDQERYRLFAWCVMPNHVHVVFQLFPGYELASVVHSWKSFTAHEINRKLRIEGAFWQREYYDHIIRNEEDLEHAINYVVENPIQAGLWGWRFVWHWDAPATAAGTAALP